MKKFAAIIAIAAFSNIAAFADTRIRFAKGRTSATVTGRVAKGGRVCYFAGAREGQRFTATVSSRSGKVMIFESGETSYSYDVEQRGGLREGQIAQQLGSHAATLQVCGDAQEHRLMPV